MLCYKCGLEASRTKNGICRNCDPEFDASLKFFEEQERQRERSRADLYWALRTRVLTIEEMQQVRNWDYSLVEASGGPYDAQQLKREFLDALYQQFKMRLDSEAKAK